MQLNKITTGEQYIASYLVQGLSNNEIARLTNYSCGTIKMYLHNLYKKLGAINRAHASYIIGCLETKGYFSCQTEQNPKEASFQLPQ